MSAHCQPELHWSQPWAKRLIALVRFAAETGLSETNLEEQMQGELLRIHGRGANWQRRHTQAPPGFRISYVPIAHDEQDDHQWDHDEAEYGQEWCKI